MKWCRVVDGIVVEIFDTEPNLFPELQAQVHGGAPDFVAQGWLFDGTNYSAPPPDITLYALQDYLSAVTFAMDTRAQERGYDTILSGVTFVGSSVAKYDTEATALKAWRDEVKAFCDANLPTVIGSSPQPAPEDFAATLPTFTWPEV